VEEEDDTVGRRFRDMDPVPGERVGDRNGPCICRLTVIEPAVEVRKFLPHLREGFFRVGDVGPEKGEEVGFLFFFTHHYV
jgi:hypothetical protein